MSYLVNPYMVVAGSSCPADICTDLVAWWDFSDIDTITKDGSNNVSQVDDKSGNDYHLVQATGSAQPLWKSAERNGLDAVDFGAAGFMKAQWSNLDQPHIVGGACYMPPDTTSQDNIHDNYSSVGGDSGNGFANLDTTANLGIYSPSTVQTTNNFASQWAYFVNTFGASADLRMDGNSKATGDTGDTAYNGITVNRHRTSATYGYIIAGEIFVYSSALSASDITALETYLSDKWGF